MAKITQIITTIPQAGKRGVQLRDDFVASQEAFQDHLTDFTVNEFNNFKVQANNLRDNVNSIRDDTESIKDSTNIIKNSVIVLRQQAQDSENNAYTSAINAQNSYANAQNVADGIANMAYALTQIGISLSTVEDGDLIMTYQNPVQNLSFNSEQELIIEY